MTDSLEVRPRFSPLSLCGQCLRAHLTNHLLNAEITYYFFSTPDFALDPEIYRNMKKINKS